MEQLSFIADSNQNYLVDSFSANGFAEDSARKLLELKYAPKLEVTDLFNRQSVSYQLSKKDKLHRWLKYKEGFSAELVNILLDDMGADVGDIVLDPFIGSGTTSIVCQMRGINSIGYDIMPISTVALKAKAAVMRFDVKEIDSLFKEIDSLEVPTGYDERMESITITEYAYPDENDIFLRYMQDWLVICNYSDDAKNLLLLCIINALERGSYTSKSGQYLSWDSRSTKVKHANEKRIKNGKKPLAKKTVRQEIPYVKDVILDELKNVIHDIQTIQRVSAQSSKATIDYINNSALLEIPKLPDDYIKGVITSPPYCNRYDYTRTYALELVYLGANEKTIKQMRQDLLSCTVESKSKIEELRDYYSEIKRNEWFEEKLDLIINNPAFKEIMCALKKRKDNGDLNNTGVLKMVKGYFIELGLMYAELFRICKKGGKVAFVNDNVRYGGEVIPVDFLSCSFAESFGFKIDRIYALKQMKGNSSQQMGKFGRVALRKSITIWEKE